MRISDWSSDVCSSDLPMIGWLVSQRVALLRPLTPVFWWPALVWMAGAGLTWLVGEAAGVGLFRQLGLILMLQGAVGAALGEKLVRGLLLDRKSTRLNSSH